MVWREELGSGRILLREVIDLEQTYGGSPGAAPAEGAEGAEGEEEAEPAAEAAPAEKPEGEGEGDSDDATEDADGAQTSFHDGSRGHDR